MDKSTVIAAKKKYEQTMSIKRELMLVKQELQKMKSIDNLTECLNVIEKEEKKIPSEEEILKYSFYSLEKEETTCPFYVFIGAYRRSKNGDKKIKDYRKADYFVYQNLEKMFSGKVIHPEEQADFEKENIVFKFAQDEDAIEKFSQLQLMYFRQYFYKEDTDEKEMCDFLIKCL